MWQTRRVAYENYFEKYMISFLRLFFSSGKPQARKEKSSTRKAVSRKAIMRRAITTSIKKMTKKKSTNSTTMTTIPISMRKKAIFMNRTVQRKVAHSRKDTKRVITKQRRAERKVTARKVPITMMKKV